jgi:hypothetical protein
MDQQFFPDGTPVGHLKPLGNALYADAVGDATRGFVGEAVDGCPGARQSGSP